MSPRIGLDADQIIQVAIEIADRDGVEAVTMATLAKQLNIRPPSLYNHIRGLPEIREMLTVQGLEKLYDSMEQASNDLSGEDAIFGLVHGYMVFARTHPGLYESTLSTSDQISSDKIKCRSDGIVSLVVNALSYLRLDEDTAIHAVRGLRSILHGFASIQQKGGFGIPLDLDTSIHVTVKAFLQGLSLEK